MNNYPFEPGKQTLYGSYQPTEMSTPPPPPMYQPVDPYAPPPPMYQPTDPYTPPVQPRGRRNRGPLIIGIVAVLVIAGAIGLFAIYSAARGGITSISTPSVHYPYVSSAYSGSVHNTTYNSDANTAMTSVVQDQGKINGNIQFGLPLIGSGSFTGTVTSSGAVHFVVTSKDDGNLMLTFSGSIASNGSMSGTYLVANGQKGIWKAAPALSPVVYPFLSHNYSGMFDNTSTGKSTNMSLQIVTQNQQNFNGFFGNFTPMNGSVGSDNSIQFTITDSKGAPIKFTGIVNIDGSLNGTYTAGGGEMGTWKVSPA